ncbi:MAG: PAS domain S-box protein [Candidatus Eremiobacteraeota bacterium]|nr:PAS domain S-box protein [Candidatus Eremiobacteraeota bacterium]
MEISSCASASFTILLVDDYEDYLVLLRTRLQKQEKRFTFLTASSADQAMALTRAHHVDCIISDYEMPGKNGLELLSELRASGDMTPFIFITGQGSEQLAAEALRHGAADYYAKDEDFALYSRIANSVHQAVKAHREKLLLYEAQARLKRELDLSRSLANLSSKLITRASLEDISFIVLYYAKQLTGSRFGYVGHIDPATGFLVCTSMTRDIWDVCGIEGKAVVFEKFNGLWGWVLTHRKPLICNDPSKDQRAAGTPKGHIPIERFLSAPALIGESLVGQIALANAESDYTSEDLMVAEQLAALYALAVQRFFTVEELWKSRERYRTLAEATQDMIYIIDAKGTITYVNRAAAVFLGKTEEEIIGKKRSFFFPPGPGTTQKASLEKVFHTGTPLHLENHLPYRDKELMVHTSLVPLKDEKGTVVSILGITRDLTAFLEARKLKEESHALMNMARTAVDTVEAIGEALIIMDREGKVVMVNAAFERLTGYGKSEIMGKMLTRLAKRMIPAQDMKHFLKVIREALEGRAPSPVPVMILQNDEGEKRSTQLGISFIRDGAGEVAHVIFIMKDITELKRAAEEREKLIAELQEALARVKTLSGILPICSSCKKIRNARGSWERLEAYMGKHSDAEFTHGLCPECAEMLIMASENHRPSAPSSP